ncbi:hypothetical protein ATO12_15810 [Aquimarina atlantica]|uniref:Phosphoribosyl-AMP cyclohydrolase n=1 Tax=Aquimarina atlantica TaxID=1317122 RepID=A0A023BTY6_9FLAO|nr:hypothetical protein [Aquimarina atlantica]EZH73404.1 hypothetical protein ATO12_15810 [Aquimarina atlantica]
MITKEEVQKAQAEWGNGVVEIGAKKDQREECERFTSKFLDERYAFDKKKVLFKPTKTSVIQFRPDKEGALSYFIAGNDSYPEDGGFAIQPWTKVRFENEVMILEEKRALAMGNYYFTDLDGQEVKVEYTFGYTLDSSGKLKIDVHHSSLPYNPGASV